ncbi:MAG: ComF family protein [Thermoguttaceae bacterium]
MPNSSKNAAITNLLNSLNLSNSLNLLTTGLQRLLDIVCPQTCILCGVWNPNGKRLCSDCADKLTTPPNQMCPRCSGKLFTKFVQTGDCGRCHQTHFLFEKVIVLGEYEYDLRKLVLRMKKDKTGLLASALSSLLIEKRPQLHSLHFDAIIPVPMHRTRRRERGVNSPDLIAAEMGRLLRLPVWNNRIYRAKYTEPQYQLFSWMRQENMTNAFEMYETKMIQDETMQGKRILIVDDIFTTGATCNEIARVLKKSGADSFVVCAIARSEGRNA